MLYASRDGENRVLNTEGTNIVLAKNRYSLPVKLPLSWQALTDAMINSNPNSKETLNG